MISVKTWVAITSAVLASAACGEPGVTFVSPIPGGAGGSASRPPSAAAGTGAAPSNPTMPSQPSTAGSGSISSPVTGAAGSSVAGAPSAGSAGVASTGNPPVAAAGQNGGVAGTPAGVAGAAAGTAGAPVGTAGAASGAAGMPAGVAGMASTGPVPCPSGWTCTDLASTGFIAKDGAGNEISASCSNGELVECDDANPKASCPALSNPFCAHVDVAGMEIISCGQTCTP